MGELLAAAIEYARRDWSVFPVEPRGKRPLGSVVPHGLKDATLDEAVIRSWWGRQPDPNIGLSTGFTFDVLDVDGPEADGNLGDHDQPVNGPTVATGKGWHVYLDPTGHGNRAGVVPGVDWRGVGGYVIAPPSIHYSGRVYEWERPGDPVFGPDAPLLPAPTWLLDLLEKPHRDPVAEVLATGSPVAEFLSRANSSRYAQTAVESELGRLLMVPEGQRNDQLNRSAFSLGQLVGGAVLDARLVISRLLEAAQRIGLGDLEAERTITSGLRSGMAEPRRIPA